MELSSIYEASKEKERAYSLLNRAAGGDLYASLFGKILTPPKFDNASADPTGLKVQIEALIRILKLQRTWYDFGNVEWRIRVGQLLFSDGSADMADSNLSEPEDGLSERDVVLQPERVVPPPLTWRFQVAIAPATGRSPVRRRGNCGALKHHHYTFGYAAGRLPSRVALR